jgi:hypothetical protein
MSSFADPFYALINLSFAGFSSFYYSIFDFDFPKIFDFFTNSVTMAVFLVLYTFLAVRLILITSKISFKNTSIPVLFILILLPNVLLALTARYQEVSKEAPLYLGALLSSVPVLILIVRLLQLKCFFRNRFKSLVVVLMALFLLNSAMVNDQNIRLYSETRRSQIVAWDFADSFITDLRSREIQERMIYSPDLINLIQSHVTYKYWSEYFSKSVGERFDFTDSLLLNKENQYLRVDIIPMSESKVFFVSRINTIKESSSIHSIYVFGNVEASVKEKLLSFGYRRISSNYMAGLKLKQDVLLSEASNSEEAVKTLKSLLN